MSCKEIEPNLWLCSGSSFSYRTIRYCKFCGQKRRQLVTDTLWYGITVVCLGCGSVWDSDQGHRRISQKRRHQARDKARNHWKHAGSKAQHREWLLAEMGLISADQDIEER